MIQLCSRVQAQGVDRAHQEERVHLERFGNSNILQHKDNRIIKIIQHLAGNHQLHMTLLLLLKGKDHNTRPLNNIDLNYQTQNM